MADNDDFKFPDEIDETKGKPVDEGNDDGFELEIQDDTPIEDKKAKPLPEKVKEELDKDNLMEYSDRVKMRLEQMKKAWHDERREKEAADRERQEALRLAQKALEENKRLKSTLSEGEKQYVSTMQSAAEAELEVAKQIGRAHV